VHSILIDETMIRIGPSEAWVWIAFDPLYRLFLGFRISRQRNILDAYCFIRHLRSRYGRKPIWTDEGTWYPEACRWLGMEHHIYPIDRMEELHGEAEPDLQGQGRMLRRLLPLLEGGVRQGSRLCLDQDVLLLLQYNFVREHSELGFPPALYDSPLKDRSEADRFISLVQEAIQ